VYKLPFGEEELSLRGASELMESWINIAKDVQGRFVSISFWSERKQANLEEYISTIPANLPSDEQPSKPNQGKKHEEEYRLRELRLFLDIKRHKKNFRVWVYHNDDTQYKFCFKAQLYDIDKDEGTGKCIYLPLTFLPKDSLKVREKIWNHL
jgi:hypothetical protein